MSLLQGSRFKRVKLGGAEFRASDLGTGARFRGVAISGVVMRRVELVDVVIRRRVE
jgi:uncharacterized protein YjbI with pentapeptide repeats